MRLLLLCLSFVTTVAKAQTTEQTVRFATPDYFLPSFKAVVLTRAGTPGPGEPRYTFVSCAGKLKEEVKITGSGPFDIWFIPSDGKPIKVLASWKVAEGKNTVQLNDHLGVIRFRAEGQPRGQLIVTDATDPGPEEKKHVAIQSSASIRTEVVVPPGEYSLWIVPESGARSRRIVDKVRVLAGKSVAAD
jgi:hypothetical protein